MPPFHFAFTAQDLAYRLVHHLPYSPTNNHHETTEGCCLVLSASVSLVRCDLLWSSRGVVVDGRMSLAIAECLHVLLEELFQEGQCRTVSSSFKC